MTVNAGVARLPIAAALLFALAGTLAAAGQPPRAAPTSAPSVPEALHHYPSVTSDRLLKP